MAFLKGKVAFIDTVHPVLFDLLEKYGYECVDLTKHSENEILNQMSEYQGVVLRSKFKISANVIDIAKNLKFIARSGSGLENIDVLYAESKGIYCFNSPEGNRDAVAEHAIGMLLCLFNKINTSFEEIKNGIWERELNRGVELKGKTIGLIGYGVMGKAFAKRLKGFDVSIIAYDKYKSDYADELVKQVSLKEIMEFSDVVSLHVNYLPENEYLVNLDFINAFKKPFYLINTARGKCVKTSDLIEGINSNKVLGACLDVLEFETVSFENINPQLNLLNSLIQTNKVIITPHIAGWTVESYFKLSSFLADKIKEKF